MFHVLVNQRGCCDYCGLPKQFFDLYPNCASKVKELVTPDVSENLITCIHEDLQKLSVSALGRVYKFIRRNLIANLPK